MLFVNRFSVLLAILLKIENRSAAKEELAGIVFGFLRRISHLRAIVYNLHFVISSFAYEKRKQFGFSKDFH